jgi:glycerol kinase
VETTALGAAIAAGLAVGVFDKEELLAIKHTAEEVFSPRTTPEERAARRKEWRKAVERSFAWIDRDK